MLYFVDRSEESGCDGNLELILSKADIIEGRVDLGSNVFIQRKSGQRIASAAVSSVESGSPSP